MTNNKYPQILLLGNGINRVYGCNSWDDLIGRIAKGGSYGENLPMPMRIVLATNNQVESQLSVFLSNEISNLNGHITNPNMRTTLRRILSMGFSDILTTNYSYELEIAATDQERISKRQLIKTRKHTMAVRRAEGKYYLHTYQEVAYGQTMNRIWHIHGEARNPSSIVIGHYHYGNLFSKIREYLKLTGNKYAAEQNRQHSGNECSNYSSNWIDAFIVGDVYVLGFGYNVAEFDLWWLLERKMREKANKGKVHYYYCKKEALQTDGRDKLELLQCYGVTLHPIDEDYNEHLYDLALEMVCHQMQNSHN